MQKFNKVLSIIQKNRGIVAIRRGLLFAVPVIMLSAFIMMIYNLPIASFQQFMTDVFGEEWKTIGLYILDGTFHITSLIMVFTISYFYASIHPARDLRKGHPVIAGIISFCGLNILLLNIQIEGISYISMEWTGGAGWFVSIVLSLVSSEIYMRLSKVNIFRNKSIQEDPEIAVSNMYSAIFPSVVMLIGFGALRMLIEATGFANIHELMSTIFTDPFMSMDNTFFTAVVYIFMIHFYWMFGIHGSNMLEPVNVQFYSAAVEKNIDLISMGEAPTEIFTKPFFDSFVLMGGSGATICIIIAIFLLKQQYREKNLAKISMLPAIFNINEPLLFGLPIVFNPIYLIPFVTVPVVLMMTSYAATILGLVPYTISNVQWTTPFFISGWAATGSVSGAILQLFNIVLGTLIYTPFVRMGFSQKAKLMKESMDEIGKVSAEIEEKSNKTLLNLDSSVGELSRALSYNLKNAIKEEELHMEYQPIVNKEGDVKGAEALLRWNHPYFGNIPPNVIVKIAEETELTKELMEWTFNTVTKHLGRCYKYGYNDLWMSINVSVEQLHIEELFSIIVNSSKKNKVPIENIVIEVTETAALESSILSWEKIQTLRELGMSVAIDDFGMGHSTLSYIQEYQFNKLKVDGSLVTALTTGENSKDIIQTIINLGEKIGMDVILECVETPAQKEILDKMGNCYYQGWLFSRSLNATDFFRYMKKHYSTGSGAKE